MNERLDALLSAERDGALDDAAGERAELERLLTHRTGGGAARDRRTLMANVDERLRGLATESVDDSASDARLAQSLASLRERLGSPRASAARHGQPRRGALGWGLAAAAAALVAGLSLLFALPPATPPEADLDAGLDDLALLGVARAADVEVIEELELLDFLAERERAAEEPQG
jgi:hypothetical protein